MIQLPLIHIYHFTLLYPYYRARKDETRIRYFSGGSNFSGNSSTDYGLQMEPTARKKFEEVTGFSVTEVGLVIR